MKDTNNQGKSFHERLAEAEERWKNATISDIIAAKRREADSIEASARGSFKAGEDWDEMPFTESDLESALDRAGTKRKEADRLEAALKRELSKNVSKNGADFGQLGDAAKLREALELCVKGMCGFCMMDAEARGMTTECVNGCEALRKAKAALDAPPRNCDVGTVGQQDERFTAFCNRHFSAVGLCDKACPCRDFNMIGGACPILWGQLPYESEVAK
jgi:hypothetical protein